VLFNLVNWPQHVIRSLHPFWAQWRRFSVDKSVLLIFKRMLPTHGVIFNGQPAIGFADDADPGALIKLA